MFPSGIGKGLQTQMTARAILVIDPRRHASFRQFLGDPSTTNGFFNAAHRLCPMGQERPIPASLGSNPWRLPDTAYKRGFHHAIVHTGTKNKATHGHGSSFQSVGVIEYGTLGLVNGFIKTDANRCRLGLAGR